MQFNYLNGKFLYKHESNISTEDRGFNFADGVYEVIAFRKKTLLNYSKHIARLRYSLKNLKINSPLTNLYSLNFILKHLININFLEHGFLYLQITRGSSERNHLFSSELKSNIFISVFPVKDLSKYKKKGVNVLTSRDIRWKRCDIKSISLLPNVLGKQAAFDMKAYEIWQKKKNYITEGTTSNAFIVKDKKIFTHQKNNNILSGVTRDIVVEIIKNKNKKIRILEKKFSIDEAYNADEAFLTSTTVGVLPVIRIDKKKVSNGKIGSLTKEIMCDYEEYLKRQIKHE
ncbi:MAG: D-amino-acid transaminase [Rickettsiales bacterium]|nr:D-amino-acid transaminase [Rickettsiales bacterium]